jgi:hypothetical protein
MQNLVSIFGCGSVFENSRQPIIYFTVTKLEDILNIIIPFFNEYLSRGLKDRTLIILLK